MLCWPRTLFLLLVAVLATGHMIAACGQKGPLYLPEPEADPRAQTEAASRQQPSSSAAGADRGTPEDVPQVAPGPETN